MPRRRPGNPALLDVKGKFRMRFRNNVSGVPIKNAPGTFVHGEIYEVSLRHENHPWWELIEDEGVIIVPPLEPQDSNYEDEGGIFVPPEAVDEEADFDELKIEPEKPGPYTPEELVAQMKKYQDLKADKSDFVDADEEEIETGLLKIKEPEILEAKDLSFTAQVEGTEQVGKVVKAELEGPKTKIELTLEEEAYLEEDGRKGISVPKAGEIEKMNKIGLVTFVNEHGGAANMRMKRDDLLTAALSIRESLED